MPTKKPKYHDFLGLMKNAPKSSESKQIYAFNIDKANFDITNFDENVMNGLTTDDLHGFLYK